MWHCNRSGHGATEINLVLFGDSAVGKSSIARRFTTWQYSPNYIADHVLHRPYKTITLDGKQYKVYLWVLSINITERFLNWTNRDSVGFIFVYDLTQKPSLEYNQKWVDAIRQRGLTNPTMLMGNKCERPEWERQVEPSVVKDWVTSNNIDISVEVSAKTGTNVEEAIINFVAHLGLLKS